MSADRVILLKRPNKLGAYQVVTDYGSLSLTPIGAMRLRRALDAVLPPDDILLADDDPGEGLVLHVEQDAA